MHEKHMQETNSFIKNPLECFHDKESFLIKMIKKLFNIV